MGNYDIFALRGCLVDVRAVRGCVLAGDQGQVQVQGETSRHIHMKSVGWKLLQSTQVKVLTGSLKRVHHCYDCPNAAPPGAS